MSEISFYDQYKHPNWQRKRLEVLHSSNYSCQNCGDDTSTLHVHHKSYKKNRKVWEYSTKELSVLCEKCHEETHESKTKINELIEGYGSGGEILASEILSGYLYVECDFHNYKPKTHHEMIGYVARNILSLLEVSDLERLQAIGKKDLKRFIEDCAK